MNNKLQLLKIRIGACYKNSIKIRTKCNSQFKGFKRSYNSIRLKMVSIWKVSWHFRMKNWSSRLRNANGLFKSSLRSWSIFIICIIRSSSLIIALLWIRGFRARMRQMVIQVSFLNRIRTVTGGIRLSSRSAITRMRARARVLHLAKVHIGMFRSGNLITLIKKMLEIWRRSHLACDYI